MASTVFRWLRRAAILAAVGTVVWQAMAAAEDVLPTGEDALQHATLKITGRQAGDAGDDHAAGTGAAKPTESSSGSAIPSELPLGSTGESKAPVAGEASGTSPLQPIPDPHTGGPVEIEAAGFNGIVPGVSTMDEVQKAWGAARTRPRGTAIRSISTPCRRSIGSR